MIRGFGNPHAGAAPGLAMGTMALAGHDDKSATERFGDDQRSRASSSQVERAREPVKEVAAPAQHLDYPGRDRPIRCELAGD